MFPFRKTDIFYFLPLLFLLPALTNATKLKIEGKIDVNDEIAGLMFKFMKLFNGISETAKKASVKQQENQKISQTEERPLERENMQTQEEQKKSIDLTLVRNSNDIRLIQMGKERKTKKHTGKKGKKHAIKPLNNIVARRF